MVEQIKKLTSIELVTMLENTFKKLRFDYETTVSIQQVFSSVRQELEKSDDKPPKKPKNK